MKKNLFSTKITYLFETLRVGEEEFVKLFWNGNKPTYQVRKKSVIDKWYKGDILNPKAFHFDTYPISKLNKNNQFFFSKDSFLNEPFPEFKKRVDNYFAYTTIPKNNFEYKYIYYYDTNLKTVTYLKIYTSEEITSNRYKIKMTTSELYKERDIDTYEGELNIINDYYHITLKNSFEIVTFYFMLNKGFRNNSSIYGLRLGLSYDKGLPISGKNLLSKELLSVNEEEMFYLNASESDTLISDESIHNIYDTTKQNYLSKLHSKIADISTFMKKSRGILNQSVDRDVYTSLFLNGISSLYQISQKVNHNRTFYTSRRRSARNIFIKKLSLTKNSSCSFVYPLFSRDSILFNDNDKRSKEALEFILEVLKNSLGLEIDMLIMVEPTTIATEYLKESIEALLNAGVKIRIATTSIDKSISSYDFIYSKSKEVAIYRNIGDRVCYFKVTNNEDSINNLSYDFTTIKKHSYSVDDFIAQKHIKVDDKYLKYLVGTWYAYSYGSIKEEDKTKIWEIQYKIDHRKNIICFRDNKESHKGQLKLYSENKSYMILTSTRSSNVTFITFYNKDIHKEIFKISMIYSQIATDKDMLTFGLFSRVKLNMDIVQETLGDNEKIMLKKSRFLEDKIRKLYMKT